MFILNYILVGCPCSISPSSLEFPEKMRVGWQQESLCRFGSVIEYEWVYSPGKVDSIFLTVDKPIILHGIRLCGYQNENYSLHLRIKDTSSSSDIVSLKRHFRSQKLLYKSSHYWGFEVLFDLPVVIENGIRYSVDAYISGAFSWRGQSGVSSLQCSGVCFKFENSEKSNNGTSVKKGQFPEFLFCKQWPVLTFGEWPSLRPGDLKMMKYGRLSLQSYQDLLILCTSSFFASVYKVVACRVVSIHFLMLRLLVERFMSWDK